MKVLVIPDVHLKPYMFQAAADLMRQKVADRAVCLMDLADDWNRQYEIDLYVQTFDATIAFAQEFPDSCWCWGNHDLSYIWNRPESGFSSMAMWTVRQKIAELERALPCERIRFVHKIDDVLFCHGGLREDYVRRIVPREQWDDVEAVLETINGLGEDWLWKDDSPLWYRPQYDSYEMYRENDFLQVVGHTPVKEIERSGNVISCDVFSTDSAGRPIGSRKFLVVDTLTWEYEGV